MIREASTHASFPVGLMASLVVELLSSRILGLLFLRTQIGAQEAQRLLGEEKAGGDGGLAAGHEAISAALLVFRAVQVEDVLLDVTCELEGEEGIVDNGAPDLFGILLDDRESLVNLAQAVVSQGIGLADIGSDISVGLGEVGEDGLRKAVVTLVGVVQGLGGVLVALEGCDGV